MNVKRLFWITLSVFITIVAVAIGISARFSLSNIATNPYGFVEDFFSQWSPVLAAAGTIILAISIFSFMYESKRREERERQQVLHALHDEIHWNLIHIVTLRFHISEWLKYVDVHQQESPERETPFEFLDTRVFDDMRSRGQLNWLKGVRMDIISGYKLIRDYNMDRGFKEHHLTLLTKLHEWLDKDIRKLEEMFKFLPKYLRDRSIDQEAETGNE